LTESLLRNEKVHEDDLNKPKVNGKAGGGGGGELTHATQRYGERKKIDFS